jgi:hypothetical protein
MGRAAASRNCGFGKGATPAIERRAIIQCKIHKRSVGRADLGNGGLDNLFMYRGEGNFLAVFSQPAVATIDLLDEIGHTVAGRLTAAALKPFAEQLAGELVQ